MTAGLLLADPNLYDTRESFIRLWVHECMRVFHDRLVNQTDRITFKSLLSVQLDALFSTSWDNLFGTAESDPLFGTFLSEVLTLHRFLAFLTYLLRERWMKVIH